MNFLLASSDCFLWNLYFANLEVDAQRLDTAQPLKLRHLIHCSGQPVILNTNTNMNTNTNENTAPKNMKPRHLHLYNGQPVILDADTNSNRNRNRNI